MFSTTIDKILCYMGPHEMKTSHYFSVLDTLWNLELSTFGNVNNICKGMRIYSALNFKLAVSRHYSFPPSLYNNVLNNGNNGRSKSRIFTKFDLQLATFFLPL